MKRKPIVVALTLLAFVLHGCMLFRNVIVEEDTVRSSNRIRSEYTYTDAKEWFTPLIRVNQTVLRETGDGSKANVRFYDRVLLNADSYKLENQVYLLLDGKPFQTHLESIESERLTNMQEKRKDVITADSSKVSVVTGYDRNEVNAYKLTYSLDSGIVNKILGCKTLRFRYYAGPDMITTSMTRFELNTLKKVLSMK